MCSFYQYLHERMPINRAFPWNSWVLGLAAWLFLLPPLHFKHLQVRCSVPPRPVYVQTSSLSNLASFVLLGSVSFVFVFILTWEITRWSFKLNKWTYECMRVLVYLCVCGWIVKFWIYLVQFVYFWDDN